MGEASSSSSATSGINAQGAGVLNINKPNYVAWIVIGAVVIFVLYVRFKRKH